jgi:long-subunit fatty acid transport protein
VAIDLLEGKLSLGVDGAWEHWSATPALVPDITIILPKTLTDLGFNKTVVSKTIDMGFSDTFVARIGAEYLMLERLRLRAGYVYRPTPTPAQTGQTNFLDTDAHLISVGAGWTFDDPLQMAKSLSVDGAAQLTLLTPTDVNKVGNNKNPNYRYGGSAWFFGGAVRYDF